MKKEYEEPKAVKIEFDYSENVTASAGSTKNTSGNGNGHNKAGSNGCCGVSV